MSKDETDDPSNKRDRYKTYVTQPQPWASTEYNIFIHGIDDVYCTCFELIHRRGNCPCAHISRLKEGQANDPLDPDGIDISKIPKGLPRNWYDGDWLNKLAPWQHDSLKINQDIPLDFALLDSSVKLQDIDMCMDTDTDMDNGAEQSERLGDSDDGMMGTGGDITRGGEVTEADDDNFDNIYR